MSETHDEVARSYPLVDHHRAHPLTLSGRRELVVDVVELALWCGLALAAVTGLAVVVVRASLAGSWSALSISLAVVLAVGLLFLLRMAWRQWAEVSLARQLLSMTEAESDERASRSHAEALAIVADAGSPYCLLLRSFGLEVSVERGAVFYAREHDSFRVNRAAGELEARVRDAVGPVPVVAVANPNDPIATRSTEIPRITLPNDGWEAYVGELVDSAAFVVLLVDELSPGVSHEVTLLRRKGLQDRTLVLLPPPEAETARRALLREKLTPRGPENLAFRLRGDLADFPRMVTWDALESPELRASPVVSELVERAP